MALTNLEVVSVPVSDQDRAKEFYVPDGNGWVLQQSNPGFAG